MAGQRLTTDTTGGVDEIIFSVLPWYKLNHLKTLHLIWIRTNIFLLGLDRSGQYTQNL